MDSVIALLLPCKPYITKADGKNSFAQTPAPIVMGSAVSNRTAGTNASFLMRSGATRQADGSGLVRL